MRRATGLMSLSFVIVSLAAHAATAADWDPNDDSFDPAVQSVVIGNRSWLGDPSPFVHTESARTGYTYVNANQYEGQDPSISISLMVPVEPGQKPLGAMMLLSEKQAAKFAKTSKQLIAAEDGNDAKPLPIETMLDAKWTATLTTENEKRVIRWQQTSKDEKLTFVFSINATKKLLGAVAHAQKKLAAKEKP